MLNNKICLNCKTIKHIYAFHKDSTRKDGFYPYCKDCNKIKRKPYFDRNKQNKSEYDKKRRILLGNKIRAERKAYYLKNRDYILSKNQEYFQNNKEDINARQRQNYLKNKDKILARNRNSTKKHWKRRLSYLNKYNQKRKAIDVNYKLRSYIRTRIYNAMKRNSKSARTLELLGCSIEYLKTYLASKFKEGMTLENYGKWHIDHIIPCCAFDLSIPEQQRKCFHYTNLQPLWAKANRQKCSSLSKDTYIYAGKLKKHNTYEK